MNLKKYALSEKRFQEITGKFHKKKLLILGDVGVDRYTIGEASRLSPEAPVPIVAVAQVVDKLGLAANVADNARAFGSNPLLASLVGKDRNSEELFGLLREKDISTDLVLPRESRRTTMKERVIANNQQVVRVDHEGASDLSKVDEDFLWAKIEPRIDECDAVIIEDYSKGMITKTLCNRVIASAKAKKKLVAVDPPSASHPLYIDYYRGATVLTPNTLEAERLSGIEIRSQKDALAAGKHLLEKFECDLLIITQGKQGMTLFSRDQAPLEVPTFARVVFDVSGAGDTAVTMLTLALSSGASLEESAVLANFAAGVEVGKPGTATVTLSEVMEYMRELGALH
jgi:rfaE bifunctional protein kinase chain/domain